MARRSALILAGLSVLMPGVFSLSAQTQDSVDTHSLILEPGFYQNVEEARESWTGTRPVELSATITKDGSGALVLPCNYTAAIKFFSWEKRLTAPTDLSYYEYIHMRLYVENGAAIRHMGVYFGVAGSAEDSQGTSGWYARMEHNALKDGWNAFSWKRQHFGVERDVGSDGWSRVNAIRLSFWGDHSSEKAEITLTELGAYSIPPKNEFLLVKSEGDLLSRAEVPIIPIPQSLSWTDELFHHAESIPVALADNDAARRVFEVIKADFETDTGYALLAPSALRDDGLVAIFGDHEKLPQDVLDDVKTRISLPAEGYYLEVRDDYILLIGEDEPGFYYGFKSLQQLWTSSETDMAVNGVVITDYPSLTLRSLYLHRMGNLEKTKQVIKGLSALKINTVFIDLASDMQNEQYPFRVSNPRPFTKAEMQDLVDFARQHYVTLCPYFQMFSHMTWLAAEPAYRHLLGVDDSTRLGWNTAWCPSNPETYAFAEALIGDAIEVFQPPYVHIGHDEMAFADPPLGTTGLSRGQSRESLIAKSINRLSAFIESKGVETIVWNDTMVPWSHGLIPPRQFDTDLLMSLIDDRTVIINCTNYGDQEEEILRRIEHFEKNDFHNIILSPWLNESGIKMMAQTARNYGTLGVMGTLWHEWGRFVNYPDRISDRALPTIGLSAAYFWNADGPAMPSTLFDWNYAVRSLFEPDYKIAEDTGMVFSEVSWQETLGEAGGFDRDFFKITLPDSLSVGTVPFHTQAPIVLSGVEAETRWPIRVDIPIKEVATKVYFLQALTQPFDRRVWEHHTRCTSKPDVGSYIVHYEDDTQEVIPLKYRWNINDWNTSYGVIEGRIAWQSENVEGDLFRMYCLEWVNPHPGKKISTIEFVSAQQDGMNPVLWAITLGAP